MDRLLYYLASGLVALFQAMPLDAVARVGRLIGGMVYYFDARHRRVARKNLTRCFGAEKSAEEINALVRENFKRIGENYLCAIKSSSMSMEQIGSRLEVVGAEKVFLPGNRPPESSIIVAIGHFGNFEMFAHLGGQLPQHERATTYRALKSPMVNRLLVRLRERTGCLYFERRTEGAALRNAVRSRKILLGLLADQHSGGHGLRLPFLGQDCNTTKAPAVFALRFEAPLHTAICYRTRLGHWRIEVGDRIPTHENGQPRPLADIMREVNRAFEAGVRRDPANWFWVHNRWKDSKIKGLGGKSTTAENESDADFVAADPMPKDATLRGVSAKEKMP